MHARAVAVLISVVAATVIAFRALVGAEVNRVVSVHVTDKAQHQVDMLESNAIRMFGLATAVDFPGFLHMALASKIAKVFVYNRQGQLTLSRDTRAASLALITLDADDAQNTLHDHLAHPGDHHHGDAHASLSDESFSVLGKIEPLSQEAIQPLVTGATDRILHLQTAETETGNAIDFVQIVLPVQDTMGETVGFAGFTFDVSHFVKAMRDSVTSFALLLVFCGVGLFIVPATCFWLQRKLAKRSSQDVQYLSQHDALTGLLNRSAFVARAEKWCESGIVSCAAYIDADRFKLINDTYGHNVGDAFLRHIAKLLTKTCGPDALVARFGGDEFTFALPAGEEAEIKQMVENLMEAATSEVKIDGFTFSSSLSIGLALPEAGDTLETLLQRADTALYDAKSGGRNQAAFYTTDMGARAKRRKSLELRLRTACDQNLFRLVYQPLVDAQSGAKIGYEALLRLDDLDGTAIEPSEFVPLAEEIGLIEDIGTWVLRAATKEIAALDDHSIIAVNLSAEQFNSGNLVDVVQAALKSSGLPPQRLELEITESILLDQNTQTAFQIDALKDMGISIAMDDFGTGFSSLSTLWRYGFDRIKIDKSFVAALEETPGRTALLIDSIVLLGSRMDMRITAEGIETQEQQQILTSLGCHVLQGYYFGRPEPLSSLETERNVRVQR